VKRRPENGFIQINQYRPEEASSSYPGHESAYSAASQFDSDGSGTLPPQTDIANKI